MCQAKVLLQHEDGSGVRMGVANHALKPAFERLGGALEGDHIHA